MALLGCFELIQKDLARDTHRTQVIRFKARGIPWLEHNISNHGYPKMCEGLCGGMR